MAGRNFVDGKPMNSEIVLTAAKFCITETGAYGTWKSISSMSDDLLDENMNAMIYILSTQSNGQELVVPLEELDNDTYQLETLNTLLLPDLWRIWRNKRLPVSGSKAIIIKRILSWRSQQEPTTRRLAAQNSLLSILMKSWFMAPFKLRACRQGTLNDEPFILATLSWFVSQKRARERPAGQWRTVIESIHEFGLMCNADNMNAAFLPGDAIAGIADVLPDGTSASVVAVADMKSKCSQATLSAVMELITLYGEYQEINAEEDPISFKLSTIPDMSYQCQLLHGMAAGGLDNALFFVASLRKLFVLFVFKSAVRCQDIHVSNC